MEIGESSHKQQIKDGFNASNKTGDYYTQMINFYLRYDAFTVRKANLEALSSQQIVVPAVANTAALVESSNRCQLKFILPQLQKGKGKVNNFRGLLEIITHSGLRKGLESATHHFLVSRRINLESQ